MRARVFDDAVRLVWSADPDGRPTGARPAGADGGIVDGLRPAEIPELPQSRWRDTSPSDSLGDSGIPVGGAARATGGSFGGELDRR